MTRRVHMSLSVRGVLRNWDPSEWVGVVTENGRPLTTDEFRERLFDELAKGHEVIPYGKEVCQGFDYSGGGCPGHEIQDDESKDIDTPGHVARVDRPGP